MKKKDKKISLSEFKFDSVEAYIDKGFDFSFIREKSFKVKIALSFNLLIFERDIAIPGVL